jgi:ubiquinone/menaquinone biosynthesis C-methylase UbiE
LVQLCFIGLFALLSPIFYLNRLDFVLRKKRNPFCASRVVRLKERYALVYELAQLVENFPVWDRIYAVLPTLAGEVLQVGCGTGLMNRYLRNRSDIRITNLDCNLSALRMGVRLGRYQRYVHAFIDKRTPLPDRSFDAIVFAQSFHHIRNHRKALGECARLLRDHGCMVIADSVILREKQRAGRSSAYLANSSIDGVIWRFTRDTLVKHLEACLPETMRIQSVSSMRRLHVTNYNLFVPQCDVVAVLVKGRRPCETESSG